jgi:hypothetical protein
MFLFCSHEVKPSFQAALDPDPGKFRVLRRPGRQRRDGGLAVCRDDSQRYSVGASKLTSEEVRRIGKAIARIPKGLGTCAREPTAGATWPEQDKRGRPR